MVNLNQNQNRQATDNYPNGCPCGTKEVDLLREMALNNIRLCVIPFSDSLDGMLDMLRKDLPSLIVKSQDTKLEDALSSKWKVKVVNVVKGFWICI